MTERHRYLVLDGFVPRLPEHNWIKPAGQYDGTAASDVLPMGVTPWVRLIDPDWPDVTALVLKSCVVALAPEHRAE